MKTQMLEKETCLNPYYIAGNQIQNIHFFKDGGIVASSGRGWLPMYGSNSSGNSALEAIEYRSKRKPDLDGDYSFYIGGELYVNINMLENFLFAPDVLQHEGPDTTYYGNMVYFECGSTDERYPHLESVELRGFMMGHYSKCIPTARGEKIKAIVAVFADSGIKIPSYDAAKMLDNKDAIIAAMEAQ